MFLLSKKYMVGCRHGHGALKLTGISFDQLVTSILGLKVIDREIVLQLVACASLLNAGFAFDVAL